MVDQYNIEYFGRLNFKHQYYRPTSAQIRLCNFGFSYLSLKHSKQVDPGVSDAVSGEFSNTGQLGTRENSASVFIWFYGVDKTEFFFIIDFGAGVFPTHVLCRPKSGYELFSGSEVQKLQKQPCLNHSPY